MGFGKKALATATAQLDATLTDWPIAGNPIVTVIGPRGGSTKTRTAAGIAHVLGQGFRVPGMLLALDGNPDYGDLMEVFGLTSRVPARLVDFLDDPSRVKHPADWGSFLDVTGRVHVLHNQDVRAERVEAATRQQFEAALRVIRQFAAVTVVDGGTSLVRPWARATLPETAHLVVACRADPIALHTTSKTLAEVVAAGHGHLVDRATVVATVVDQHARPEAYSEGLDFLRSKVGAVHVVPYDRAAGAVGPVRWDRTTVGHQTAMVRIVSGIVTDLQQHAALPDSLPVNAYRADPGQLIPAWPVVEESIPPAPVAYTPPAAADGPNMGWQPDQGSGYSLPPQPVAEPEPVPEMGTPALYTHASTTQSAPALPGWARRTN